jgi:hypothetical protein
MRYLIILLALCSNLLTFGQNSSLSQNNQQWAQYYNQVSFKNKISLVSDFGFRSKNSFGEYAQYISRVGLAYQIYPEVQYTVGFAHLGCFTDNQLHKIEVRPYQEVLWTQKKKNIGLMYRIRVEERFFQTLEEHRFVESTFNLRFRYYLKLTVPIHSYDKEKGLQKISFNVGNELFLNAGKQVQNQVFDQNRIILGPCFSFAKKLSCNLNYNFQYTNNRLNIEKSITHVVWLGVKHQINYISKNEKSAY